MKEYTVIWTYLGNYAYQRVRAMTDVQACREVTGHFSEDFQQKGMVYVFEGAPSYIQYRKDGKDLNN